MKSLKMGHLWDKWDIAGPLRIKSGPSEAQVEAHEAHEAQGGRETPTQSPTQSCDPVAVKIASEMTQISQKRLTGDRASHRACRHHVGTMSAPSGHQAGVTNGSQTAQWAQDAPRMATNRTTRTRLGRKGDAGK